MNMPLVTLAALMAIIPLNSSTDGYPLNGVAVAGGPVQIEVTGSAELVDCAELLFANGFEDALNAAPDVAGLSQAAAESAIVTAGLVVGTVTTASSNSVAAGDVISQSPTAGTIVAACSAVNLVVSLGAALIPTPDVVGLSQAAAESAIVTAGLVVGTVTTANSNSVAAGNVISQSPSAGTDVSAGSSVNLVVSLGAALIPTPDVVGLSQAAAESAIVTAGLVVGTVTTASSNSVAAGNVISQSPTAGTDVAAGSAVGLIVSLGEVTEIGEIVDYQGPPAPDPSTLEQLPIDPVSNLPVVLEIEGASLQIDPDLRDPITALVRCSDWVVSCLEDGQNYSLDDCVRSVPVCATSEPWLEDAACCPASCYTGYRDLRLVGEANESAFMRIFHGHDDESCFP